MFGFNIIYGNSLLFLLDGVEFINYTSKKNNQEISFSYKYFDKFKEDKIFSETEEYVFGIDGVILNLKKLKNSYGISNYTNLISHLWNKRNHLFPNELKGEFSGFVFDKKSEELFVFCNQTATKLVYYSKCEESVIISSNISQIIAYRKFLNLINKLNRTAVYSLFTYGAMFEKETLIEDIERLQAGECLSIFNDDFKLKAYQNFNNINIIIDKKNQAIDLLEESFANALNLEYEKDLEYNYGHFATLSGGLDSRMNVMLANKNGYKNDVFCFSQSNYLDEHISREIADDLNLKYDFIPLDNGDYFKNITENVAIVRGTSFYLGAAHLNYALSTINCNEYGLLHTGLIGDAILGGFISNTPQNFSLKKMSTKFSHKIEISSLVLEKYSSEETFKLQNRIFNLINNGSYTVENHKTYLVSPFMDVDFINVCLSIEPKLKKKGKLYLEWIAKYHSELVKYKWERTGFTPTHIWKTELSRYTNKLKLEYYKTLKKENRLSMNPLEFWYRNNANLRLYFNKYFDETIELVDQNELKKEFEIMFKGNVIEKSMVITVLEFIKKNSISV